MLEDSQRKVFTILCNHYNKNRFFPDFKILQTKTNKTKTELIEILQSLADQFFIEWDNLDITTIKILRLLEKSQKLQEPSTAEQVHRFYNEY